MRYLVSTFQRPYVWNQEDQWEPLWIGVLLNYWLAMRTAEEIQSMRFFPQFRRYAEAQAGGILPTVEDIRSIGKVYRDQISLNDRSVEGRFMYRWGIMDAGVTTPVILWFCSNRGPMPAAVFERSLSAIESYRVRRML